MSYYKYPFNKGLVKSVETSLMRSINFVINDLNKIKRNEIRLDDSIDEIIKENKKVANGLKILGLKENEFFYRIEMILNSIKAKKALPNSLEVVINSLDSLREYLEEKFNKLDKTNENDFYPIELWKEWTEINNLLGRKYGVVELFIPFCEIKDDEIESFIKVDPDIFKNRTLNAYKDFVENSKIWSNCNPLKDNDKKEAKLALSKMIEVVDSFINLKIRDKIYFYGYLIALKARLLLAYESPDLELDNKKNLQLVLDNAVNELLNYRSKDVKKPEEKSLKIVFSKLLTSVYKVIANTHIGKEVAKRFNFKKFEEKAKLALNEDEKNRKEEFRKKRPIFLKTIGMLKTILENIYESNNVSLTNNFYDILKNLLRIKELMVRKEFLTSLEKLVELRINLNEDKNLFINLANYIYLLEIYIENFESVPDVFLEEFTRQNEYIERLLNGDKTVTSFDLNWKNIGELNKRDIYKDIYRSLRNLISVVKTNHVNYGIVENEAMINTIIVSLSNAMSVLTIMNEEKACNLLGHARYIAIMQKDGNNLLPEMEQNFVKSIQAVENYVEGLEKEDFNAKSYLDDIYQTIFEDKSNKVFKDFNFNYGEANVSNHIEKEYSAIEDVKPIVQEQKPQEEKVSSEVKNIKKTSLAASVVNVDNLHDKGDNIQTPLIKNDVENVNDTVIHKSEVNVEHLNEQELMENIKSKQNSLQEEQTNDRHIDNKTQSDSDEEQLDISKFEDNVLIHKDVVEPALQEQEEVASTQEQIQEHDDFFDNNEVDGSEENVVDDSQNVVDVANIEETTSHYQDIGAVSEVVETSEQVEEAQPSIQVSENKDSDNYQLFEIGNDDEKEDLEIYIEEYNNGLMQVDETLTKLQDRSVDPYEYQNYKKDLKRFYHTMKGNSNQLGYTNIGLVFTRIDACIKQFAELTGYLTNDFFDIHAEVLNYVNGLMSQIEKNKDTLAFEIYLDNQYIDDLLAMLDKLSLQETVSEIEKEGEQEIAIPEDGFNQEDEVGAAESADETDGEEPVSQEIEISAPIEDKDYPVIHVKNEPMVETVDLMSVEESDSDEKQDVQGIVKPLEEMTEFVSSSVKEVVEGGSHQTQINDEKLNVICSSLELIAMEILKIRDVLKGDKK